MPKRLPAPKLAPKEKKPKAPPKPEVHKLKGKKGVGWYRKDAEIEHAPVWYVIVQSDDGRQLQGCSVAQQCIETRHVERGKAGYIEDAVVPIEPDSPATCPFELDPSALRYVPHELAARHDNSIYCGTCHP